MNRELFRRDDLITYLQKSGQKIAVYGTGNGAAKLIDVLNVNGLDYSAVFASDAFVRGQEFLGKKVLTLKQTEDLLGDFTVLVGFASSLPEVISAVKALQNKHKTLIPEINVCGNHLELFDRRFFDDNYEKLSCLYDALSDETSKSFLVRLINYKLTGDPDLLWELDGLCGDKADGLTVRAYADLGAYTGDTVDKMLTEHPELEALIAFEPDNHTFRKLSALAERSKIRLKKSFLLNAAAGNEDCSAVFSGQGRGSSLFSQKACPGVMIQKPRTVSVRSLDSVMKEIAGIKLDLVKFDVEGCEKNAISGALRTLKEHLPSVEMSVYHNRSDLTELFFALKEIYPDAFFYLTKKQPCFPAWDVRLTVIPRGAKHKPDCS